MTLVASMLISPLMGPILAGVFGAVIGDKKLRNQGVVNELVSLGICIVTGFVLGLLVCPWIEVLYTALIEVLYTALIEVLYTTLYTDHCTVHCALYTLHFTLYSLQVLSAHVLIQLSFYFL